MNQSKSDKLNTCNKMIKGLLDLTEETDDKATQDALILEALSLIEEMTKA